MLPISVSNYIFLNILFRHSVNIFIVKLFFYNYVSLYVLLLFCTTVCLSSCLSVYLYLINYHTSVGRSTPILAMDARIRKHLSRWSNDIWLSLQHLQMWRGFFLTLEWWWRIGEPCYCWRGSTRSSFFGRILLCWILN